jgi:hypothetical protein
MANGKWQMANGKWQMANGKWQMANGKRQMANGKWQMANAKWGRGNSTKKGGKFHIPFLAIQYKTSNCLFVWRHPSVQVFLH